MKSNLLTEQFGWRQFIAAHGSATTLLFLIEATGQLRIANSQRPLEPHAGSIVIALVAH